MIAILFQVSGQTLPDGWWTLLLGMGIGVALLGLVGLAGWLLAVALGRQLSQRERTPSLDWRIELATLATLRPQPKPVADLIVDWEACFAVRGLTTPEAQDQAFRAHTKALRMRGDYRLTAPNSAVRR